jgi:hypothetical protein
LWTAGGFIIGLLLWFLPPKVRPQYTAETFIRILPGTVKGSAVVLIKAPSTFEALVDRDEVQKTDWFQQFGKTKDDRMAGAVADLRKRFKAYSVPDSDLVSVSMTCRDGREAAMILNETVDKFLTNQRTIKKKETADKLSQLQTWQLSVQRDLDMSEQELDNVRRRYGFTDLEEHVYPDPRVTRLMDLQNRADNCALEIKEVEFLLEDVNTRVQILSPERTEIKSYSEMKKVQSNLNMLQSRFKELQRMQEEAAKGYAEFSLAKAQYAQRASIRDERKRMLDSIKQRVEELKILYDEPEASGIQFVAEATAPREADRRAWQEVIPPVVLAAIVAGIIQVLMTKKKNVIAVPFDLAQGRPATAKQ